MFLKIEGRFSYSSLQWRNFLTTGPAASFSQRARLPHYNNYFTKPNRHNKIMSVFNDNNIDS